MLSHDDLTIRLMSLVDSALTGKDGRTFVRSLNRLIEQDPFGLDWTALLSEIPETVDLDIAEGDRIAVALSVIASDDDEATTARTAWEDARPKRSSGARKAASGDNPVWTRIAITRDGTEVHSNSRNPGAMSSLYFPAWEYLRDEVGMTKQNWDPIRKAIVEAALSETELVRTEGDLVIKVTY